MRILTLYSEVWTWKRNTCLCHQVKNGSNVIECQLSEKLESQGDGSLAAERYPRNSTASEYGSKSFGKWIPGTPAIPKTLQKRSAEFLNIGKRHFHQLRNSVSKTSESITGRIPRGHRHALWLAKRYPIMQVRNIVDVEASGLPPGMIGTQEPKSGYHYGDCASTGTPLITNPLESWKMGFLTPHTFFTPCALLQNFNVSPVLGPFFGMLRFYCSLGDPFVIRSPKSQ